MRLDCYTYIARHHDLKTVAGTILEAILNAPGSWHDLWVALPVYERPINNTPEGFYLVADTAFL